MKRIKFTSEEFPGGAFVLFCGVFGGVVNLGGWHVLLRNFVPLSGSVLKDVIPPTAGFIGTLVGSAYGIYLTLRWTEQDEPERVPPDE